MEPAIDKNGKVIYLKKDGSASHKNPKMKVQLKVYGYEVSRFGDVSLKWGDPYEDDKVIIRSKFGFFLLEKDTDKVDKLDGSIEDAIEKGTVTQTNLKDFVKEPPPKEKEVNPEDYIDKDDFEVVKKGDRYYINAKYKPSHLYFSKLPDGWSFLEKGDAALTRAVKKEKKFWKMYIYNSFYRRREYAGIIAPTKIIEQKKKKLGGAEGINERAESKVKGQQKREEELTKILKKTIKSIFPNIPEQDLRSIISQTRGRGRVGKRKGLYFNREEVLEDTALLSVQAHIRHTYTNYEKMFDEFSSKEDKKEYRRQVRPEVEKKLEEWREEKAD